MLFLEKRTPKGLGFRGFLFKKLTPPKSHFSLHSFLRYSSHQIPTSFILTRSAFPASPLPSGTCKTHRNQPYFRAGRTTEIWLIRAVCTGRHLGARLL
jgi:hypothetical protein